MKWRRLDPFVVRQVGPEKDSMVPTVIVDASERQPGDVDFSEAVVWRADYKGFSYVISWDGRWPEFGYVVSCQPLDQPRFRQQLAEGITTFTAAEKLCASHARGRRDA